MIFVALHGDFESLKHYYQRDVVGKRSVIFGKLCFTSNRIAQEGSIEKAHKFWKNLIQFMPPPILINDKNYRQDGVNTEELDNFLDAQNALIIAGLIEPSEPLLDE